MEDAMKRIWFASMRFSILLGLCLCLWGCSTTSSKDAKPSGGASTQLDKTVYYQNLSGTPGWNASVNVSKVTTVANPDAVTAEFTIKSINELEIFKRPSSFNPQNGSIRADLSYLKDTVALVCAYNPIGLTYIPTPYMLGVTHVHSKMADQVRQGSLYPVVVSIGSDDKLYLSEKEKPMPGGFAREATIVAFTRSSADSTSKYYYVWFLPNMPASYDIVFPYGSDKDLRKVNVKLD
jgi:hypothetical protein